MPSVAVLGGSVVGGATALLFARAGWSVTLIDPEFSLQVHPGDDVRRRPGAPQATQAHAFPARARHELRARLPDILSGLDEVGANRYVFAVPASLGADAEPADRECDTFRVRRAVLDAVVADAVRAEPGVRIVEERVRAVVLEPSTVPRATAFVVGSGEKVAADVLIDAGGRRSPVSRWLADMGIVQPDETSDCGLTYYSRHHRIVSEPPPMPGFAIVLDRPDTQLLGFRGDRDMLTLALVRHDLDRRRLHWKDPEGFETGLGEFEELDDWRRAIEPAGGVHPMGTVRNRMTALVRDGVPLVLGLHQVGDSLTTTNPSRGRGVAFGLMAAGRLLDVVAANGAAPDEVALEVHAWQQDVVALYFRETCVVDLELAGRIRATLTGGDAPQTAPDVLLPEGHPVTSQQVTDAAMRDAALFRLFVRALHMMDDERVIASAATAERVGEVLRGKV